MNLEKPNEGQEDLVVLGSNEAESIIKMVHSVNKDDFHLAIHMLTNCKLQFTESQSKELFIQIIKKITARDYPQFYTPWYSEQPRYEFRTVTFENGYVGKEYVKLSDGVLNKNTLGEKYTDKTKSISDLTYKKRLLIYCECLNEVSWRTKAN